MNRRKGVIAIVKSVSLGLRQSAHTPLPRAFSFICNLLVFSNTLFFEKEKWSIWDSNPRPPQCECGALPTALMPQTMGIIARKYGFVIKNFQIHDKIFKYNFAKSPWNTVITACREIRQAVPLRNKYIIWISEHFTLLSPDTSSVLSTPARRSHCRWLP